MSTWLAENPEMLQVALEIVDSWDNGGIFWGLLSDVSLVTTAGSSDSRDDGDASVSSRSSSGRDSPQRLPSLVIKPSKIESRSGRRLKTSTKISTQNRRRAEIKSLRTMSMELERQLKSLLQTTGRGDGMAREDMASVWRDIAQRQQQLRSLAEAKQWSLRCRLNAQMNIERELVRLFQKARAMENDPWIRSIESADVVVSGAITIRDLEQLRRIDRVSENIDAFFASPRFHDGMMQFVDIRVLEDQPGQFVIEMSQAWTVPFEVDRTLEALWKFCYIQQKERWCSPDITWDGAVRLDAMALVADFNAVAKLGSAIGYFDAQVVVKRFLGSDTTPPAIITDFFCRPNHNTPGSFAGVHTQERTCLRVLPAMPTNTNVAHRTWHGSHVQVSQRLNINFSEGDSTGRHHAGLFRNTVLGNLRRCADQMHKNVESMLITSR